MLRRFGPLFVLLALSLAVLLARMWDVQVVEHEVWAREAANIVRSYGVEPYTRGTIRDRRGRPIVRDEKRYVLEFVWRDFRRGHPVGQVAMLRSLALARPVGLDEARRRLVEAALDYVRLSPNDLDRFSTGNELEAGIDYVPALPAADDAERTRLARDERRRARAADMRFYILRLLGLSRREVKRLGDRVEDLGLGDRSFIELAASVRDESPEAVARRVERSVRVRDEQLVRLAGLIEWGDDTRPSVSVEDRLRAVASKGDRLVALIEERRRDVDDDIADALFELAAGFSPERLDESNLARLELDWLRRALAWDDRRLAEWRRARGASFVESVRAGFVIARSKLNGLGDGAPEQWPADRVLSSLAHSFRSRPGEWERRHVMPQDWRQVDRFAVLDELSDRLEGGDRIPSAVDSDVFVFQDERLRASAEVGADLVQLALGPALGAADVEIPNHERAQRLVRLAAESWSEWNREDAALVETLLAALFGQLQARVAWALDEVARAKGGRVAFGDSWIERAQETRRYIVRDRGARPKRIGEEPGFDLVLLVTRYGEEFAGFRARAAMERTPIAFGPDGERSIAAQLIGSVRSPFLVDLLKQRRAAEELVALQRKRELPEEDAQRILEIVDAIHRPGETVGGSGIEAWFDAELSGKSGYHEVQGLQDRIAGNRDPIDRGAVDGLDLDLTLDIDLQRAAEAILAEPELPPAWDRNVDELWFEAPVGAIVLARVDGRILAAASAPFEDRPAPPPGSVAEEAFLVADGQALFGLERTLRRPTFQPPGSVVKPLLAAYALEHLGLDPREGLEFCDTTHGRRGAFPKRGSGRAGYGAIDCNVREGHSRSLGGRRVSLRKGLMLSCNVYFAALAEQRFDARAMRDAYAAFGFGSPTGVRYADGPLRSGLVENAAYNPRSPLAESRPLETLDERARQFLGNGLNSVDASVVQVARAYAALATGALPTMRLVERVDGEPIPLESLPLGLSDEAIRVVHAALDDVIHHPDGTGFDAGLREDEIGFRLAAKTGSADYMPGLVPGRERRGIPLAMYRDGMRKHAWLAGWFPSKAPRYVVVVYLHDTSATASHSAAYVAKQFLKTEAVKALVRDELATGGAGRGGPLEGADEGSGERSAERPIEAGFPR